MNNDDDYDDGSVQCAGCENEAVGYDGDTPLCANCYRGRPRLVRPVAGPDSSPPDNDRGDDDDPEDTPIVRGDDPDELELPEPDRELGGES